MSTPVPRRPAGVVCLVLAALLAAGCERAPDFPLQTAAGRPPNVLLITIDSLRPDHLGAYGYPVPTSPAIDGLAVAGVRFTQAIASAPETSPAVASLLTGLYQYRSRVLFNRGTLPPHLTTLAESARAAGYATAGFAGNLLLAAQHGFDQGFAHFESFAKLKPGAAADDDGAKAALAWLDAAPPAPWLLWIHFVHPHGPYVSADAAVSADFEYPPWVFGDDQPLIQGPSNVGLGVVPKYQQVPGFTRPRDFIRRYDGEIRSTDTQVGRLLDALDARGESDDTLVVLTADHGESLLEHRELFQHGWFVYDTTLRVPLILSWPGVLPAGRVVETQVSGVDLAPTLHQVLGLPTPGAQGPRPFDGASFGPLLFRDEPSADQRAVFAVGARQNHPFAVRWAGWKLIHTPAGRPPVPVPRFPPQGFDTPERFELYNLRTDPAELANVAHKHPNVLQAMQHYVTRFRQTFRKPAGG